MKNVLGGLTPYEKCFGKKPDYEHLKVFGCLRFVSTLKRKIHKFMPRAQQCVGYSPSKKGYKVYNPTTKIVSISKDVVFYKNFFPYQYKKDTKLIKNKENKFF